jgi:hypothetical protein
MIQFYRFLDWLQSTWNRSRKTLAGRRRWGAQWRDKVRPGRTYTRVYDIEPLHSCEYFFRPEPGWEWFCPNCKDYSLITESMMPAILEEWKASIARMAEKYQRLGVKMPAIPPEPTAVMAGCPNCKYRPGAPE